MHLIQFVTIFITMWHNEGIPSDVHSSLYLSKKCIYCKNQFIASIFDEDKNCFQYQCENYNIRLLNLFFPNNQFLWIYTRMQLFKRTAPWPLITALMNTDGLWKFLEMQWSRNTRKRSTDQPTDRWAALRLSPGRNSARWPQHQVDLDLKRSFFSH